MRTPISCCLVPPPMNRRSRTISDQVSLTGMTFYGYRFCGQGGLGYWQFRWIWPCNCRGVLGVGCKRHVERHKAAELETALEGLKDRFENVEARVADISTSAGVEDLIDETQQRFKSIDILINNAGIALGGPVILIDIEIFRKQFEVNFFGLIAVTKAYLPLLGACKGSNNQGKIINISSVSGRRSYPFIAHYTASKFAVEAY